MADPLWTSEEVARAAGGVAHGRFEATGVTFDSREVEPGDLFVALVGARDGHDFVDGAMAGGAAGVLVSRPVAGAHVRVADTLQGLKALALAARERAPARRCVVTGSVGKTSVTQAIAAALRLAGPAHASVKSFNNHIGVPLTLARMLRTTERAVFEIGMNHAGEIGPLSRLVAPHVAVVTNVGPVHTENFPDGEAGVARAKAEVFEGLAAGGVAVIPADGPWADGLRAAAERAGARVLTFGVAEAADARLLTSSAPGVDSFQTVFRGERLAFQVGQAGAHWGLNGLAVLLACAEMGVPRQATLRALESLRSLPGRGQETQIVAHGGAFTLVDESYNANPISMRAALDTLSRRPGRRVVVLTDMLELGPEAERLHAQLAQVAFAAGVELAFSAGPHMRHFHDALPPALRGRWAETAAELAPVVVAAIGPGDVVMVKGSNGSKASLVAHALAAMGEGA